MALVPVLNSSFYALNSSYYARWYYMPILIMCAATMHALEDADIDLMRGIRPVAVITAVYLVFILVPKEEDGVWSLGVVQQPAQFWLIWLTAVLGVLLFFGIVKYFRFTTKFYAALLAAILPFSVFYSVCHIGMGKFPSGRTTPITAGRCSRLRPALHGRRTISTGWIPTSARTTSA